MEVSPRKGGRPSKYDWDDKRDICHKLYVEEKKSVAQIIDYFANIFNVPKSELPSCHTFFRQIQHWGFPSRYAKKLTPEEELVVLARIKQLWEQNVTQRDIKQSLADEGYEIKTYEFKKLWRKLGLRLRHEQGYQLPGDRTGQKKKKKKRKGGPDAQDEADQSTVSDQQFGAELEAASAEVMEPLSAPMDPDATFMRQQRLLELQLESDERLQARKRRRRIRGYGHLPPDAPGTEPRYNSETSLDECKAFLHLTNELYQQIRQEYEVICREMGIIRKTQCAEGVWEASKRRLMLSNMHLAGVMHPLQPEQERKTVALDCLCADVTKRMRFQGRTITIAESNNVLGLNPTESKIVRRALYEILAQDNFESRLVSGEDHFQMLRQRWYATNDRLTQAVNEIPPNPTKMRGIDMLCRDAMKRFREDKNRRGERTSVVKNAAYGPGPGPAWAGTLPRSKVAVQEARAAQAQAKEAPLQPSTQKKFRARAAAQVKKPAPKRDTVTAQADGAIDLDLDPALSTAAASVSSATQSLLPLATEPAGPPSQAVTAYFRLGAGSEVIGSHPKMWLGRLASATITELQKAAKSKAGAAKIGNIHGMVKNDDGTEDSWLIENNDELAAYLDEAGEKPSFSVVMASGYA